MTKFRNYPITVFLNDIDFGVEAYGERQYIQDVTELSNGDYRITTDVQTFAIKEYAFAILESRIDAELNYELDSNVNQAMLEDYEIGFHQH